VGEQLVAEQLVTVKTRRGFTRLEWQKLRERNEALDCRVYARAAAWIAGADRWAERKWRGGEAAGDRGGNDTHPDAGDRRTKERADPSSGQRALQSRGWEAGPGTGSRDNNQRLILTWTQAELDALRKRMVGTFGSATKPLGRVRFGRSCCESAPSKVSGVAEGRPKPRRSLATFRKG
jgi:hypothetical protein